MKFRNGDFYNGTFVLPVFFNLANIISTIAPAPPLLVLLTLSHYQTRSTHQNRTPGFVATFVLRKPEVVDASSDHRELNPIALYVPITIGLALIGVVVQYLRETKEEKEAAAMDDETEGEQTALLSHPPSPKRGSPRRSTISRQERVRSSTEINRRASVTIMGITMGETHQEVVQRLSRIEHLEVPLEQDEDIKNLDW
jgi:hypothetical protein